ncbi:hypothetical protein TIFTF001_005926 [Ficus carica]|uniref:Rx N-terminal domain-containing protein n=1 Tax=Ficus carica TaxID=3494 RepID=A0AA87ZKV2_FICCA|nr:hypothetical protein TIFTF001_005926 [Ficus carica]
MAEALVSSLITHLGSVALARIEDEIRLVKGVDEDVANLKTNLEDIEAADRDIFMKNISTNQELGV